MITIELVENIRPFERKELFRFITFKYPKLRSEVTNCIKKLFELSGQSPAISREELHRAMFPKLRFDDKVIRYLLTDVNRILTDFYTYKALYSNENQRAELLLNELTFRGCDRYFDKAFNQELKTLNASGQLDPEALRHEHELLSIRSRAELSSGQRVASTFEKTVHRLDDYFVAKKLQISAELINSNFILNKPSSDTFLETILTQVDSGLFSHDPYIQLYRSIIRSMLGPNESAAFTELRASIPKMAGRVASSELSDLYQYQFNYCIRRINAGDLAFQDTLLNVYQSALENDALLSGGKISQWDFKNVVTIALRTSNLSYAREFIHSYKTKLPMAQRTNALAYNLANLNFFEGDHRSAIKQLQKVDLDDVFYRLDARSILLKVYYELDDQDALFYHATAFRSLLQRNRKISDNQRKLYLNLIKFTLAMTKTGNRAGRLEQLKSKVLATPNVADLSWLEAKLTELEA